MANLPENYGTKNPDKVQTRKKLIYVSTISLTGGVTSGEGIISPFKASVTLLILLKFHETSATGHWADDRQNN